LKEIRFGTHMGMKNLKMFAKGECDGEIYKNKDLSYNQFCVDMESKKDNTTYKEQVN
jgi:hypothetical protein